jgi:hypothetical protein
MSRGGPSHEMQTKDPLTKDGWRQFRELPNCHSSQIRRPILVHGKQASNLPATLYELPKVDGELLLGSRTAQASRCPSVSTADELLLAYHGEEESSNGEFALWCPSR